MRNTKAVHIVMPSMATGLRITFNKFILKMPEGYGYEIT